MVQKILKTITNNFGLKVLAVVIAIVFWLVIVNVEDPEKTKNFTIRVEMQNTEVLEESGMTYEILDSSDVITFTVSGQRSIVERLTVEDFVATADFENLENMSQVPIMINAKKYANNITITKRSQYVSVFVESIESATVPVEVETVGEVPEGFLLADKLQASQDTIRVTGPQSVVESVVRAVAWIDITALEADSTQKVDLVLYNEDGDVIETDRLTLSNSVVTVSIGVLERTTVPVVYEVNGTPSEGYRITSVKGTVSEVSVVGKSAMIDEVTSIVVDGPDMSVAGATKTLELVINLNDYLPEGISLAEGQDADVTVTVTLEGKETKELEMLTENIQIKNIPAGVQVVFVDETVPVVIKGYPSELKDLTGDMLKGTVDAVGAPDGTQVLKVTVAGDYQIEGTVEVTVRVTRDTGNESEEENESSN